MKGMHTEIQNPLSCNHLSWLCLQLVLLRVFLTFFILCPHRYSCFDHIADECLSLRQQDEPRLRSSNKPDKLYKEPICSYMITASGIEAEQEIGLRDIIEFSRQSEPSRGVTERDSNK
ncbi:hypothetical protein RB195_012886 [Necator americanus]|uniref:Uncharacterized protein n=1 Tax=Necator americanus TaxID=51031 RepID=A0ABR1DT14_NECAM